MFQILTSAIQSAIPFYYCHNSWASKTSKSGRSSTSQFEPRESEIAFIFFWETAFSLLSDRV